DHALQGSPEGELHGRPAAGPRLDGRRRTATGADRRRDRQRLLRRDRSAHARGAPDAGPRARDARRRRVVELWLVPELTIVPRRPCLYFGAQPPREDGRLGAPCRAEQCTAQVSTPTGG